jgi:hypothetical protein
LSILANTEVLAITIYRGWREATNRGNFIISLAVTLLDDEDQEEACRMLREAIGRLT